MSESKLGKLATGETKRDAMHVAVVPAHIGRALKPGTPVEIVDGEAVASMDPVGIIDPFLKTTPQVGSKVWVLIYPNQVTNLRHEWDYPGLTKLTPESHDDYDADDECRHC